jgi:hypothetical protein
VLYSNPGGSDEATIFAWQAALNLTDTFAGLKQYDLMSRCSRIAKGFAMIDFFLVIDTRGTYSSNPLNVSLEAFEPLLQA